jgi:hypothetical protein
MTAPDVGRLTPLEVRWKGGRPVIEWCDFRGLAFTDPFFIHTFFRLQERYPETPRVETGVRALRHAARLGGLAPSGFIFHMSRCGSTLVSRLLGSSSQVLALGEPDPVLGMLEFPETLPDEKRVAWLRDLILALGRPRRRSEASFLIKFTSYNLFALPLIRRAFPRVPWVFIYRDPVAVMASVSRKPTGFLRMKARPEEADRYLAIGRKTIVEISDEEYLARFLGRMCEFILDQAGRCGPGEVLLVDYARLPAAITAEIAPFLGIDLADADQRTMDSLSKLWSKDRSGERRFDPGSAAVEPPNDQLLVEAARWMSGPHRRLRALDRQLRDGLQSRASRRARDEPAG